MINYLQWSQGDLHYHLSQHGVFNENEMKFYAAEVILGLEHMHRSRQDPRHHHHHHRHHDHHHHRERQLYNSTSIQATYSVPGPEACQHIARRARWVPTRTQIFTNQLEPKYLQPLAPYFFVFPNPESHNFIRNVLLVKKLIFPIAGHVRISDLGLACDFRFVFNAFEYVWIVVITFHTYSLKRLLTWWNFQQKETARQCWDTRLYGSRGAER